MTPLETQPAFHNQLIRLTEEEKANPLEVLHEFFETRSLQEARETLWEMVETALIADHTRYDKAEHRHHLLWFYRALETLVEAGYCLVSEKKKR